MSKFVIGVADFFGVFKKARKFLKGKKTMLSSIVGMLMSAGAVIGLVITWTEGGISTSQLVDQATLPATAFWAAATFLFAANHSKNVVEERLGPGQ